MSSKSIPDFKKLFESSPGLFLILSPKFEIMAVTDAYLEATLTVREEIIGRGIFEVFPDNPDNPEATGVANLKASLERALSTKIPDAMAVQKYDIQLPEEEGGGFKEKFWSPLNTPVLNSKGEVEFIIHKVEDITEFIQLKQKDEELETKNLEMESEIFQRAQQLQITNQKLRESEKIKSEFFANVSHELRTPLSLIIAPLETLISGKKGPITPEQGSLMKVIHNNAIRLLQMVNGLLDFAKFEAGKMTAQREPVNITREILFILNDFTSMIRGKKLDLINDIRLDERLVLMDRYKFERILFNLLSNATKFTFSGGTITVKAWYEDNSLVFSVEDTGIGIPESEIKNLFQKFKQAEGSSTRRFSGTGLGLAMIKEFSEILGGSVQVSSTPGKGSIFTVTLPVTFTTEKEDTRYDSSKISLVPLYQPDENHDNIPNDESRDQRILVCEDNEELRSYITELISGIAEIKVAENGAQGIDIIKEWIPDLIISDVMMPEMDGIELCKRIKSNPETSDITVVLLTAMTHRAAMLRGWEANADEYLFKPFHPDELVTRVKTLLSSSYERKLAKQELENRALQLQMLNSDLESFTYSVSHDLRTPLRAIDGFSRVLAEEHSSELTGEAKEYLTRICDAASDMNNLINDLLEFSRLGRVPITKKEIDMHSLAAEAFNAIMEQNPGRSIELVLEKIPFANADLPTMRQVWSNLISNAVKYTSQKENAFIHIGSEERDNEIVYFIKDNGAGFDMRYSDKLFGVFQRLHRDDEFSGTGVGLAIVKKIISRHGGRIFAFGKLNEGAQFYFSI